MITYIQINTECRTITKIVSQSRTAKEMHEDSEKVHELQEMVYEQLDQILYQHPMEVLKKQTLNRIIAMTNSPTLTVTWK